MTGPRTGGTIEHPANLYPPGTGVCPTCGGRVRTHGGGRAGSHTPDGRSYSAVYRPPMQRPTTCPGTGQPT